MAGPSRALTRDAYRQLEAEYHLAQPVVDEVIARLREEGYGPDLLGWLHGKRDELTQEQCAAAVAHIRAILYGRRGGLMDSYAYGHPATAVLRLPVAWPSSERTDWELWGLLPRLDTGAARLAEAGEGFARLDVDLSLPFVVGHWRLPTLRPVVVRLAADAANLDTAFDLETVRARQASVQRTTAT